MKPQPTEGCPHCKPHGLGYLAFHADARRRIASGERQVQCPGCRLWTWPDHLNLTLPALEAMVRRI